MSTGLSAPRGTGNDTSTASEIWLGVSGESFTRRCKKDDPGAIQVFKDKERTQSAKTKDKDGNEQDVYRTEHREIVGRIKAIGERKAILFAGEETTFTTIHLEASGQMYRIDLKEGERHWENFVKRLRHVDITKDVELKPYSMETENKAGKDVLRQGIAVYQDGVKIVADRLEDMPAEKQPREVENPKTGKMEWTFLEQNRWIKANILEPVKVKLEELYGNKEATPAGDAEEVQDPF